MSKIGSGSSELRSIAFVQDLGYHSLVKISLTYGDCKDGKDSKDYKAEDKKEEKKDRVKTISYLCGATSAEAEFYKRLAEGKLNYLLNSDCLSATEPKFKSKLNLKHDFRIEIIDGSSDNCNINGGVSRISGISGTINNIFFGRPITKGTIDELTSMEFLHDSLKESMWNYDILDGQKVSMMNRDYFYTMQNVFSGLQLYNFKTLFYLDRLMTDYRIKENLIKDAKMIAYNLRDVELSGISNNSNNINNIRAGNPWTWLFHALACPRNSERFLSAVDDDKMRGKFNVRSGASKEHGIGKEYGIGKEHGIGKEYGSGREYSSGREYGTSKDAEVAKILHQIVPYDIYSCWIESAILVNKIVYYIIPSFRSFVGEEKNISINTPTPINTPSTVPTTPTASKSPSTLVPCKFSSSQFKLAVNSCEPEGKGEGGNKILQNSLSGSMLGSVTSNSSEPSPSCKLVFNCFRDYGQVWSWDWYEKLSMLNSCFPLDTRAYSAFLDFLEIAEPLYNSREIGNIW